MIDVGASLIVANAGTRALFGSGVIPFLTEGWLTDPTGGWRTVDTSGSGTDYRYTLSLAEIVKGMIPGGSGHGAETYSYKDMKGMKAAIALNMKQWGPQAIATTIGVPIAAKILKRVARKPIADANILLKWSGVQNALGVKV